MQTFLPDSNFKECARVIDNKRLWKQILEANQLIELIHNKNIKSGWRNCSVYKMWENYLGALYNYRDCFIQEWLNRRLINANQIKRSSFMIIFPWWLKNKKLHASHRAALLEKNPEWYQQFGWKEEPKIEYFWPKNKD